MRSWKVPATGVALMLFGTTIGVPEATPFESAAARYDEQYGH